MCNSAAAVFQSLMLLIRVILMNTNMDEKMQEPLGRRLQVRLRHDCAAYRPKHKLMPEVGTMMVLQSVHQRALLD